MARRSLSYLALLLALAPSSALALTQPDGSPIPSNGNLKNFLDQEGESIDPVASVATTPQSFDPTCNLTFKVLARGGGQLNSFGWYNITGQKPAPSDLHEFLGCNDGVGVEKVLAIKSDPAYQGGKIGFFMASTQGKSGNCVKFGPGGPDPATLGYLYYSEPQYNDDNQGANSYIHLVILDSKVFPKAFYFGWEDLANGGDNDFEDLLTRVSGISCAGGGVPCETGVPGVCAQGITQCKDGVLACLQASPKGTEACNAVDDDCDGQIDEGDLCEKGYVCYRGKCVEKCGGGEFQCPAGLQCDPASGFCLDPGCVGKTCAQGQICRQGACAAPCSGVTCPVGQVCRLDTCVDPCAGVTCAGDAVCEGGVCKDRCGCGSCPGGKTCVAATGLCVDPGCDATSCAAGSVCVGGACVDACKGVACPPGQACQKGACEVSGSSGGAGGSGGGGIVVVAGAGGQSSGGEGGASAQGGKAGTSAQGGKGGKGGRSQLPASDPGSTEESSCGCRAAGAPTAWPGALALASLLALRRRRRAR